MDALLLNRGLLVLGPPVPQARLELGAHRCIICGMSTVNGRQDRANEQLLQLGGEHRILGSAIPAKLGCHNEGWRRVREAKWVTADGPEGAGE